MLKELLSAIPSLVSAFAIVAAGLWAYFRVRVERSHTPHIELDIDCQLLGPERGDYLAEIVIVVNNKGLVRQDFQSMDLRVRAICEGDPLEFYSEKRIKAPLQLLDAQVIKKKSNEDFLFVEPGVRHLITYATKIPKEHEDKPVKYLFLRVKFHYDPKTPHSIERVYSVAQCLNKDKKMFCIDRQS